MALRLEGAHDESRTQHVRVHLADPGSLGGRADPPVCSAAIEPAAVVAEQDRPSGTFPIARSIVRAVLGTSGMTAGLLPLPTMRSVR